VRNDDHGHAALGKVAHHVQQLLPDQLRVESGVGLVQQHALEIDHKRMLA